MGGVVTEEYVGGEVEERPYLVTPKKKEEMGIPVMMSAHSTHLPSFAPTP